MRVMGYEAIAMARKEEGVENGRWITISRSALPIENESYLNELNEASSDDGMLYEEIPGRERSLL